MVKARCHLLLKYPTFCLQSQEAFKCRIHYRVGKTNTARSSEVVEENTGNQALYLVELTTCGMDENRELCDLWDLVSGLLVGVAWQQSPHNQDVVAGGQGIHQCGLTQAMILMLLGLLLTAKGKTVTFTAHFPCCLNFSAYQCQSLSLSTATFCTHLPPRNYGGMSSGFLISKCFLMSGSLLIWCLAIAV